jgi:hypothetical protein
MSQLINLIVRTILRGAIYRYVFRLPKTVLIPLVAIAVVGFLVVNHK